MADIRYHMASLLIGVVVWKTEQNGLVWTGPDILHKIAALRLLFVLLYVHV